MAYKRISPIPVVEGGSGAITLTGVLSGNGTAAITGSAVTQNAVLIGGASNAVTSTLVGTTGQVLTGITGAAPTFQAPASSSISLTGDSGGALTGNAFTITGGTSGLTFAGAGTTETVGGSLVVANGGTAATSFSANGVVVSNTTTTGALSALPLTSGQLVIGGTGAPAAATLTAGTGITITNASNSITIAASGSGGTTSFVTDSGTATPSSGVINFQETGFTEGTLKFKGSGNTVGITTTDTNGNVSYGNGSGILTSGASNCFFGSAAGNPITTGSNNTAIGAAALGNVGTAAANNTAIGYNSLIFGTTLLRNTAVGFNTGNNYATTESDNILIGQAVAGTTGESNALHIGNGTGTGSGNLNKAFICGITGITVTGTAVLCSTAGQLGTIASSRKYKDNIQDMDDSACIYKLRAKNFTMKNDPTRHRQWGFIAEDVEQVNKDLVNYHHETKDLESVRYLDLIPMLVNEIQILQRRIVALEGK